MLHESYKVIVVAGATASGKSSYALKLAAENNGVIINADSMQVYQELPILTAQPFKEDMLQAPHKLYGIIKCSEHFSIGVWLDLAKHAIEEAVSHGKQPIVVGGTGFYLKALQYGLTKVPEIDLTIRQQVRSWGEHFTMTELHQKLATVDEALAERLKVNDRQRILRGLEVFYSTRKPLSEWQMQKAALILPHAQFHCIHINPGREVIYDNCNKRFLKMLEIGLLEEINDFDQQYHNQVYPKVLGLEQMLDYQGGKLSLPEAIDKTQQLTRNFAKRQLTWLRNQLEFDEVVE